MEPGLSGIQMSKVEGAVPEVLYSSRSWRRSGEGVEELKSKREGVAVLRSLDDRLHIGRTLKPFFLRCSIEMLNLE